MSNPNPCARNKIRLLLSQSSISALVLALASAAAAQSLPTGGSVSRGTVTLGGPGNGSYNINQTSARAVVNWSSFNVGAGQSVYINQPSQTSALLNRVTGSQGSVIDGYLYSNGQVFLVNPNGVTISSSGVVYASGGFVASTLDLTDDNFMNGTLQFSAGPGGAGAVINRGNINRPGDVPNTPGAPAGGPVVLLGSSVENDGRIYSLGKVGLGAAMSATLDLSGDGFLQVVLPADATDVNGAPLVNNTGSIQGAYVALRASVAADAVRQAVNTSGQIATTVDANGKGGDIVLTANGAGSVTVGGTLSSGPYVAWGASSAQQGGTISLIAGGDLTITGLVSSTGAQGGRIDATGVDVNLTGASLNVDGSNAGGLVRLGGAYRMGAANDGSADFQYFSGRFGPLPALANANTVTVDGASMISADGPTGGTLIVSSLSSITMPGHQFGASDPGATYDGHHYYDAFGNPTDEAGAWWIQGTDGAVAISTQGVITQLALPISSQAKVADHLYIGAQEIRIANTTWSETTDGVTSVLGRDSLATAVGMAKTATIEASDILTISDGFSLLNSTPWSWDGSSDTAATLQSVDFRAGRGLMLSGPIEVYQAQLSFVANDPGANSGPGGGQVGQYGAPFISAYSLGGGAAQFGAQFISNFGSTPAPGDLSFTILPGSDTAGAWIALPNLPRLYTAGDGSIAANYRNLSITAPAGVPIQFWGDIDEGPASVGGVANPPGGALTLSGSIEFAVSANIAANGVTWINRGATPIISDDLGLGVAGNFSIFDYSTGNYLVQSTAATILPTDGVVSSGDATITSPSSNVLSIVQNSERAVIDWSSFNIGANNLVQFQQPDASAAILNRVPAGTGPSAINGSLGANGQVFLVNPDGIVIGATGAINTTGGFVASTLDIGADGFMNGALNFSGAGTGSVSNAGSITAGSGGFIALLGGSVVNTGSLTAPQGSIGLGAGSQAALDLSGGPFLQVTAATGVTAAGDALVDNSGTISAAGGQIQISAINDPSSLQGTLNLSGTLDASASDGAGGSVTISATGPNNATVGGAITVDGSSQAGGTAGVISLGVESTLSLSASLSAQADAGGRIDVTGGALSLTGATLDASGVTSGGLIRLGGAYRNGAGDDGSAAFQAFAGRFGALPTLALAGTVSVDAASTVRAEGATGGTIIVNSASDTSVSAALDAGSAGGAMAISSSGTLSAVQLPDSASNQPAPQYLMLGAQTLTVGGQTPPAPGVSNLDLATLEAVLARVGSASIEAGDTLSLPQGLALASGPNDLTLRAGQILFQGDVSTSGSLTLSGSLAFAADTVVSSTNLAWAQDPTTTISGYAAGRSDFIAKVAFVDNGTVVARGILVDGQNARVDLKGLINNPQTAVYGVTASDFAGSAVGLINGALQPGDTLSSILAPGSVTVTGPAPGRLQAGVQTLTASASGLWASGDKPGYFLEFAAPVQAQVVITPVTLTYQAGSLETTYGSAANPSATLSGVLSGDTVTPLIQITRDGAPATGARLGAGAYGVTVSGLTGAQAGDYVLAASGNQAGVLTVDPKSLTFAGPTLNATYGDAITLAGGVLNGVLSGDTVSADLALQQAGQFFQPAARQSAGAYAIGVTGLSGADAANYVLAPGGVTNGSLTIAPRALTAAVSSVSYQYGSPQSLVTLNGVLSGDDVAAQVTIGGSNQTLSALGDGGFGLPLKSAVGQYDFSLSGLSGAAAANYTVSAPSGGSGEAAITARLLTWTLSGLNSVYGTLADPTIQVGGVLAGDAVSPTLSVLAPGGGALTLSAKTPAASYALQLGLGGSDASNYALASTGNAPAVLAIAPKPISYTIADLETTYGSVAQPSAALQGVLANDDVTGVVEALAGAQVVSLAANTSAGRYSLSLSGLSGASAGNYTVTSGVDGLLTVSPKPITASLGNLAATYGSQATPGASLSGVLAGDAVSAVLSVTNGQGGSVALGARTDAGAYQVAVSGLTGAAAGDYVLSGVSAGTLTIAPKPITYSIADLQSVYGTAANPAASLTGVLPGDAVSATVEALSGGQAVALSARTAAGVYQLLANGLSGAQANDYAIASSGNVAGALTIAPKPIGLTGALSATYGTVTSLNLAISGVLSGDDVAGSESLLDSHGGQVAYTARTNAGTYVVQLTGLSGADAGNYTINGAAATGTLQINPLPISLQSAVFSATYGQVTGGSSISYLATLPALSGDDVEAVFTVAGAANGGGRLPAGSYALTLTSAGGGLTGASAANYVYAAGGARTGSLTVAPLALNFTYSGATSRTYGDSTAPSLQIDSPLSGDQVTMTQTIGGNGASAPLVARSAVGTYVLGMALGGADASDYIVQASGAAPTFVINPRPVTLASGFFNQTYGDTNANFLTNVLSGDVVAANISVSGSSGAVPLAFNTPAGSYSAQLAGLTGAAAANYTFSPSSAQTLTIAQRPLTIGTVSATYGDPVSGANVLAAMTGIVAGDASQLSVQASAVNTFWVDDIYSGTKQISETHALDGQYRFFAGNLSGVVNGLTGAAASNYRLSSPNFTLAINSRVLTYTRGGTFTYGDVAAGTVSGLLSGDAVSIAGFLSGNVRIGSTLPVGVYTVTSQSVDWTGAQTYSPIAGESYSVPAYLSNNYILAAAPTSSGPLVVVARPITYTIAAQTNAYNGAQGLTPGVSLSNLVPGDAVAGTAVMLDAGGNVLTTQHVGVYATQFTGLTGAAAGNYTVTGGSANPYTITPRQIAPSSFSYTYGDAPPSGGASVGDQSLLAADGVSASAALVGAPSGETLGNLDAGSYRYALALSGANAGDFSSGRASITVNPRTITYTIAPATTVYGTLANYDTTLTNLPAAVSATPIYKLDEGPGGTGAEDPLTANVTGNLYWTRIVGLSGQNSSDYRFVPSDPSTGQLTITPRPVAFYAQQTVQYGTGPSLSGAPYFEQGSHDTQSGVLPGDSVSAFWANLPMLDVGTYAWASKDVQFQVGGGKSSDYQVNIVGAQQVTITPRPVTIAVNPGATFDSSSQVLSTDALTRDLYGLTLQYSVTGYSGPLSASAQPLYTPGGGNGSGLWSSSNANVGQYSVTVSLSGSKAADYVLANPNAVYSFKITPEVITPSLLSASTTYGSASGPVLTFSGGYALQNDVANGLLKPVYSSSSQAFSAYAGNGYSLGSGGALLDVGAYAYALSGLTGQNAADYVLASNPAATLTITPKSISFVFNTANHYYGDQTTACPGCGMTPDTTPLVSLSGQVPGSSVAATATISSPQLAASTYNASIPAGDYTVTAQLSGKDAGNYVVQGAVTSPLTVQKAYIGYQISSGQTMADLTSVSGGNYIYAADGSRIYADLSRYGVVGYYIQGPGYVGADAGKVTLNGVVGSDPVEVVVGMFPGSDRNSLSGGPVDPAQASPGTYHLQVVGFAANLNNYQLAPAGSTWGEGAVINVINLAAAQTVEGVKAAAPSSPYVLTSVGTLPAQASAGSAVGVSVGDLTAAVKVDVGAAADASAPLGGATMDAAGKASASADVKAGPLGASAEAKADASGTITATYDHGSTTVGVGADASATASIGLTGAKGAATVSDQVYAVTDVTGSIGGGADGDLAVKASVGSQAQAQGSAGYSDGKVTVGGKATASTGVEAGVTGKVSGDAGSVTGGVTISTGQVGAGLSPSAGYSDGMVSVGLSGTLGLGAFGVSFQFTVSIDAGTIQSGLASGANALANYAEIGPACDARCSAAGGLSTQIQQTNPITQNAQMEALYHQVQQSNSQSSDLTGDLNASAQAKLTQFQNYQGAVSSLKADEGQASSQLSKLASDPAALTLSDVLKLESVNTAIASDLQKLNAPLAANGLHAEFDSKGDIHIVSGALPSGSTVGAAVSSTTAGGQSLQSVLVGVWSN